MNVQEFVRRYYVDRNGSDCYKWDSVMEEFGSRNLLPLWIADMDFKMPNVVRDALRKRVEHGVFGYTMIPDSYYNAIINWNEMEHKVKYEKDWIRVTSGIVPALYHIVQIFSKPGDSIMELSPVFFPFRSAVIDNGRKHVQCHLKNKEGIYTVDFKLFEDLIVQNKVKIFINCSPHNPVGRIWDEGELDMMYSICKKHRVLIVADEIHQDLEISKNHIPSIAVRNGEYKDMIISFQSASKTFNMAGMLLANIIIPNEKIRAIYDREIGKFALHVVNPMSIIAVETAYSQAQEWKRDMIEVIRVNYNYLKSTLEKVHPEIIIAPLEGTYLAWVDLTSVMDKDSVKSFCINEVRIAPNFGEDFDENYKGFFRINLATSPANIIKATDSLVREIMVLKKRSNLQ